MATFVLGTNLKIEVEYKNSAGELEDVISAKLSIQDPTETEVKATQDMTKESLGKYYYSYTPTVVGNFCVYVLLTNTSGNTIAENEDFIITAKYR